MTSEISHGKFKMECLQKIGVKDYWAKQNEPLLTNAKFWLHAKKEILCFW